MSVIILYSRGFLGFENGMTKRPENMLDIKEQTALVRFQKPSSKFKTYGNYNDAIERLYKQLKSYERNFTSFNYRRSVLSEALRAFGTSSFRDWCKLQEDSYTFSENHRRFIEDTLKFVATGERNFGLMPWEFTLKQENATFKSRQKPFDFETFFNSTATNGNKDFTVLNLVQLWVSQPKGFEDMLVSLHLIFGKTEVKEDQ